MDNLLLGVLLLCNLFLLFQIEFRIRNVFPDLFTKEPIFKKLKNKYDLAFDEVKSIEDNGTLGKRHVSTTTFP